MHPEVIASSGSESANQKALFAWAALNFIIHPELKRMFAIPNGSQRNLITGARLKAEGVKIGIPDIFLPAPRGKLHGLFIEMKRRGSKGVPKGVVSDEQEDWHEYLNSVGYFTAICYGWEEAVIVIKTYLEY